MKLSINPSAIYGQIKAIPSKSVCHRLLICAAFADAPTRLLCEETNADIEATASCLCALGASVVRNSPYYDVTPISPDKVKLGAVLDVGESGSTLRFLLPVVAALGANSTFVMHGRLPSRPLSPLDSLLCENGVTLVRKDDALSVSGKLLGHDFCIDGGVSSQFISGMLFALTLMPSKAHLTITGRIESAPYIDITVQALTEFGAAPVKDGSTYTVTGGAKFISPLHTSVEGDWSNAAFPLCLGVLGGDVTLTQINSASVQGDREIVSILSRFGADIECGNGYVRAKKSKLTATDIDASNIPDLVPVLSVLAAVADGKTTIYNASRLRTKESDRLHSVYCMLSSLGAKIEERDDSLVIEGVPRLTGGVVDSFADHRIAMSAAVASCVCESAVTLCGAQSVAKSYPSFWEDAKQLGMTIVFV